MEQKSAGLHSRPVEACGQNHLVRFDRLLFDTGKDTLQAASQVQLQAVASILKAYPNVHARIGGYSDNTGEAAANLQLSQARATNVMDALVKLGVAAGSLDAKGYVPNIRSPTTRPKKAARKTGAFRCALLRSKTHFRARLIPYALSFMAGQEFAQCLKFVKFAGRGPQFGHRVSHAHNITKRRWDLNLQTVHAVVKGAGKRLRVCTSCIRNGKVQKASAGSARPAVVGSSLTRRSSLPFQNLEVARCETSLALLVLFVLRIRMANVTLA